MNKVGDIFTKLSDKYGLHRTIIIEICAHPFRFASRRIADPTDSKSIMIQHFGKFILKPRYNGNKSLAVDLIEKRKDAKYDKRKSE